MFKRCQCVRQLGNDEAKMTEDGKKIRPRQSMPTMTMKPVRNVLTLYV
jgi:hypothetical protein